jgi:hypothetical protein
MNALELLVGIGAMDEETNELTDLGICLSGLSLEPREYLLLLILLLHKYLFSILIQLYTLINKS